MDAKLTKEHEWLKRLVGDWRFEVLVPTAADGPPQTHTGTQRGRALGGGWVVIEGEGLMPGGGESTSMITLGYDPACSRFVGTFVASMMHHLWLYEGQLDAAERVLTLDTEGPSMMDDGTLSHYRDAVEIVDENHWVLHSSHPADGGGWQEFMTMRSERVGPPHP